MYKFISILLFSLFSFSAVSATLTAIKTSKPIAIDGVADENWQKATWYRLDQLMLGVQPTPKDFSGKFKVMWDEDTLYLLAEITDDVLYDGHSDPLQTYWDDDCLEVFLDEDHSGGEHQFNFNAFAYHVALDNQVVDIAGKNKDGTPMFHLFNDHVKSIWKRDPASPHHIIWEMAIKIYKDNYKISQQVNYDSNQELKTRAKLFTGKILGFMLAYCDNDGSKGRESFVGSTAVMAIDGDKNRGYKDASIFDALILKQQ